jgi:hypothetical protein
LDCRVRRPADADDAQKRFFVEGSSPMQRRDFSEAVTDGRVRRHAKFIQHFQTGE